jgi:outer membrane protein OmpA-like peptidoglycan-associated protein
MMRDDLAAPERIGVPGVEQPAADIGQAGGRANNRRAEIIVNRPAKC